MIRAKAFVGTVVCGVALAASSASAKIVKFDCGEGRKVEVKKNECKPEPKKLDRDCIKQICQQLAHKDEKDCKKPEQKPVIDDKKCDDKLFGKDCKDIKKDCDNKEKVKEVVFDCKDKKDEHKDKCKKDKIDDCFKDKCEKPKDHCKPHGGDHDPCAVPLPAGAWAGMSVLGGLFAAAKKKLKLV